MASVDTELCLEPVLQIIQETTDDADELVKKPLRQTLKNSGKLLRPSLLMWAARCGKAADRASIVAASAALELLHTSTLIHDDIIDDGTVRRGLPCVHSLFGNSVAVYTGDYIIAKCFKLLHDSGNDALVYDFVMASEKLCKSEIVQYQNRGREIGRGEYMKIAAGKTGALFSLALTSGAKLGGLDDSVSKRFGRLGENFGIAFQIADDCLDFKPDGSVNKDVMGDLRQGLYTMPVILALEKDDGRLRALLREERTEENLSEVRGAVIALGGIQDAKGMALSIITDCRRELNKLPVSRENNYFTRMLNSLEEQEK